MVPEDGLEAEPVEEAVEDRQGTDGVGVESLACGAGGPAGPERWRGRLAGACRWVIHVSSPMQTGLDGRCGPAARQPRRHDRGEGEKVKGEKF
jgi:hypothetical protein